MDFLSLNNVNITQGMFEKCQNGQTADLFPSDRVKNLEIHKVFRQKNLLPLVFCHLSNKP